MAKMDEIVLTEEMVMMDFLEEGVQGPQGLTGPQGKKKCCRETLQNMQSILVLLILTPDKQVPQVPVWVVQRTVCPNITGTQLVYAGRAAGSWWSHKGGGANCICLPNGPSYLQYRSGTQTYRDYLYGSEHETSDDHSQQFITTMYRVQSAMFPPGEQC